MIVQDAHKVLKHVYQTSSKDAGQAKRNFS